MMVFRSVFAALLAALALGVLAAPAPAQAQQGHVINLRNAEIGVFIDDVSAVTGYTLIPSPEVRGNVTVVSQYPLSAEEVFDVFLATLRVHGFAAVRIDDRTYRIVPQADAAGDAGAGPASGDAFSTVVLRLSTAQADEVVNALSPVLSAQGAATANPETNSVIIVDFASNLARVRQVVAEMDRDSSQIVSVPVLNMSAREMAQVISGLAGEDLAGAVTAVPVRAGNSVVLRGEPDAVARMTDLIADLDRVSMRQDSIRVIRLDNADAEELAPVIEEIGGALFDQTAGGEGDPRGAPNITFYPATNSLVLSAEPEMLNELERVIAELDVRRPQVHVEAIIVEVSDVAAQALGLQYLFAGDEGFLATPYENSAPNILALAGALIGDDFDSEDGGYFGEAAANSLLNANGLAAAAAGQNANGDIFGAILTAVGNDQDSNILSTPSITTLDNQPALVNVGQEIPISTGEVLSDANTNPFRTIERKNVGTRLEVRPQIGEGDTIKLFLSQEVSAVIGPVNVVSGELITSERQIETTVLADDGEVIVLGGLIQEDDQRRESKVPLLGDIPVVGAAFRTTTDSRARTNLMVFIRPTILRDADSARAATGVRLNYMRGQQAGALEAAGREDEISIDRVFRDAMGGVDVPPPQTPAAP